MVCSHFADRLYSSILILETQHVLYTAEHGVRHTAVSPAIGTRI